MYDVPMTRTPEGASETGVPDITTAGPPGVMVVPATVMAAADGAAAKVTSSTEKLRGCGEGACGGERAMLDWPTTRVPERARDTGVPPSMIAGSPGASVEPATTTLLGLTGTTFPAAAVGAAAPGTGLMIMPADGSSDITCPPTVAGSPFTKITFPPTATTEGFNTVIGCPTAGEMIALVGPGGGIGIVVSGVLCPGISPWNALKMIPPRSGKLEVSSAGALTTVAEAAPLITDGSPEPGRCELAEPGEFPEPGEILEPGGLPGSGEISELCAFPELGDFPD